MTLGNSIEIGKVLENVMSKSKRLEEDQSEKIFSKKGIFLSNKKKTDFKIKQYKILKEMQWSAMKN